MKRLKYIPLLLFISITIFWINTLIKIEILTIQNINKFPYPNEICSMSGNLDFAKILSLSDTNARIYYVSDNHSVGNTAVFIFKGGKWVYEKWVMTIWSKTGSADGFVWPYFWHSAEGIGLFIIIGVPLLLISLLPLCSRGTKQFKG